MDEHAIQKKIVKILQGIVPGLEAPAPESKLFESGILDSFGIIEFVSALEDEFDIKIANEDMVPQNLWSVAATAQTVQRHLAVNQQSGESAAT